MHRRHRDPGLYIQFSLHNHKVLCAFIDSVHQLVDTLLLGAQDRENLAEVPLLIQSFPSTDFLFLSLRRILAESVQATVDVCQPQLQAAFVLRLVVLWTAHHKAGIAPLTVDALEQAPLLL